MPDLGKAYVQIVPSAQGIQGAITSVLGGEVESAGNIAERTLSSKISLGAVAGAAAVTMAASAIAGFVSDSIAVGTEFDTSMSQVAATMGTTVDDIEELREYALEMGSTTAFSATQAAEALNYMALAGYDVQTSMEMLPNVLNLAAAGGIQLASASDMITDAQSALGLTIDDTTALVDQMAAAASNSNTSVEQLGNAILTIGATARGINGGTTELATVLGVLADNGIKGAEGGTHLRNILLSLQTPSEAGAAALAELGMSYEDMYDSAGNMRSIPDIILEMQTAMEGMTEESKIAIISGIFNKTDLAAVNALLGTSEDRFNDLSAAIENSAGAAERMANTQLDNLGGDITLFQSAVEGLQIALSDSVNPALRFFVQLGTEAVSALTDIVNGSDDAVPSVDELTKSAQSLFDTIEDGKASLSEDNTQIEAAATVAGRYIKALEDMGGTANLTADEHQRYHNYLVLLTQTVPELSGLIDLETDSIEGGTEALWANLEAWETTSKKKAAQEYINNVAAEYADVLIEQEENSIKALAAEEALNAARERQSELIAELGDLNEREALGEFDFDPQGYQEYQEQVAALGEEINALGVEISTQQDALDAATQAQLADADAVAQAEAEIALAEQAYQAFLEKLDDTADAAATASDNIGGVVDAVTESGAADAMSSEMDAMEAAVEDADIITPMEGVVDGAMEAVESSDFTTPGEAIPDELASGITQNGSVVSSAATTVMNNADTAANGETSDFYWIGYHMDRGIISGLNSNSYLVSAAARNVAKNALDAAKNELGISSPSKAFRDEVGVWIPEGIAEGIREGSATVTDSVSDLADAAVEAYHPGIYDFGFAAASAPYSAGSEGSVRTVSITNNFTVNGAESPEDYANRLARQLNMQIRMA